MLIKYAAVLIIVLLTLTGCIPYKEVISPSNTDQLTDLDRKLTTKKVTVKLRNNTLVQPDSSILSENHLSYFVKGEKRSADLEEVQFIKTTPKFSYSGLAGVSLIIFGGVYSYRYLNGNIDSQHWSVDHSLKSILAGIGVFIIGHHMETQFYEFEHRQVSQK